MEDQTNHFIYSFPKGNDEKVQFAVRVYKGKRYIDLRVWFEDKRSKSLKPTKKGIFFNAEHINELKRGVEALCNEMPRIPLDEDIPKN